MEQGFSNKDIIFFSENSASKYQVQGKPAAHGTLVEWQGHGILLIGGSETGKSDLALRLLGLGAMLIADDYVILEEIAGKLRGTVPKTNAGKIEVRGVGIVQKKYKKETNITLVLELTFDSSNVTRMPEARFFYYRDVKIPLFIFYSFEVSACEKIQTILEGIRV
jgi:serine kinase of HPr protein (carbohydrate metabolism regulator)